MQPLITMQQLIGEYLEANPRYSGNYLLSLYNFNTSDAPIQLCLRLHANIASQGHGVQKVSGELVLEASISPQNDPSAQAATHQLAELIEYLSWFGHLSNQQSSLRISPSKTGIIKLNPHPVGYLSYQISLMRTREEE
jgi:hypothetical protein